MKKFYQSLKRQDGFTLVELMVVVAIIGLLSAVAIPNFKKYQAKSKVSEAKLQLSALYTAQTAFFSDFNMYGTCLRYMGFDPFIETAARYYAVGFPAGVYAATANAYTAAQNSGLNTTGCPNASAVVDANATNAATHFVAGKGVGANIVNTAALAAGNTAGTAIATASCTEANLSNMATFGSCIGTQVSGQMSFQAAAVGIIASDFPTAATGSGLNINHLKQIKYPVQGY